MIFEPIEGEKYKKKIYARTFLAKEEKSTIMRKSLSILQKKKNI